MKNKKIWLGILVLVFGMAVAGCKDGSTADGADSALNGTWRAVTQEGTYVYKFDNGSFEESVDEGLVAKGIYTTSGNLFTLTPTHLHGSYLGLASKWYTKTELKASLPSTMTVADLDAIFESLTLTYYVSGNNLTFVYFVLSETYSVTFTRS